MNTVTKTMSPQDIEALYKRLQPQARQESHPQHTLWQLKTSDMTITAYNSGKVVFQGKDVSWLQEDRPQTSSTESNPENRENQFPMAGSDEVGTGDYFGPVCVAAVIIPDKQTALRLEALKITDSKAMSDKTILKTAPEIMKLVPFSIQVLRNPAYNKVWNQTTMNLNRIKSLMHNRVYLDLRSRGPLPDNCIVDQFCAPSSYYKHVASQRKKEEIVKDLYFETKAESRYIAVAAASVLARYTFLKEMEQMDQTWNFHFEKGAGSKADGCARRFVAAHGRKALSQVAKIHFANTAKIDT